MTLLIVDPWQSCVCFITSCVTRCTLLMVLYLDRCASADYKLCSDRTSVHFCAASLQNLAVPYDFYFPLSVPLNDLANLVFDGVGLEGFGFQEQGQCFFIDLSCSIPTIVFYYFSISLLSVYRLVLWPYGLLTDIYIYIYTNFIV